MSTVRVPHHDRDVDAPPSRPKLKVVDSDLDLDIDAAGRPRRSIGGVVMTMLVVLLFASLFGVVVFQVFLMQTQSHLDDLDRQIATEELRSKQLRLDTADLESPDRIMADGKALGMIPPNDVAYIQSRADDDAKAQFDPSTEKAPVTTTTTPAYPGYSGNGSGSGSSSSAGASGPTATTKATTPTTKATTPTTKATTPTTKATTPTTKATTPTTKATTPTTKATTPTTRSTTPPTSVKGR